MHRSIDFAVIDNLRASASQGQHAHVIRQTFAIGNELQNLQLHLLDLRARSYVACAQFANALETATTMQQTNPASALGYLCQGYIHMEQGRHIAASHVYDKALERVDKHDPLYETVQAANTEAIQQGEKRRDFLCDLPMEISAFIIQQLFTCDPLDQQRQYVMVSLAWWHRIIASNHLEYTIQAHVPLDETNDMVIQSFNYTRSLTLKACKSPFGAVFQQHRFTCLTTLAVYASRMGAFAEIILALQLIGSQLTDLTLVYKADRVIRLHQDYRTRLQYVLEKCPNLISLHCEATIHISGINHVYPKLRELKLYGVRGTVDGEDVMMIREHMPGLKILDMAITGSTRPLFVKDTWLLRHLSYGDRPTTNPFGNIKQYGEEGLVSFSITDALDPFQLDDIAPLIIHHHATLQFLEFMSLLSTNDTRKVMDDMHNDQHTEFKQLKTLQTYTLLAPPEMDTIQPFCTFITWIIERAPYLHTVALKGYTMTRSSSKALAKCIQLRHVDFEVQDTQRPEDHDLLVAEFLRDHVDYTSDKGEGSHLESIDLQLHEAHPMLINAIPQLKCLTRFRLIATDLESEPFTQLFESLRQGCQSLRKLFIRTPGAIPNRILYQIGGLSNIRLLTIIGDLQGSQAGVLSLQRCRHLERIIHYRPIDEEIRSILLQSSPHLEISYL